MAAASTAAEDSAGLVGWGGAVLAAQELAAAVDSVVQVADSADVMVSEAARVDSVDSEAVVLALAESAGTAPAAKASAVKDSERAVQDDSAKAQAVLEKIKETVGFDVLQHDEGMSKVSVIGIGMRSHAGVAATAFKALSEKGINIRAITTSEIKISILIDGAYTELAVRTLHSVYGLDKH